MAAPRPMFWTSLGLAALVFVLDQLSKWGVVALFGRSFGDAALFSLPPPPAQTVTGFLNLVLFGNTGIAFSLFTGSAGRWLLVAIAVAIAIGLVVWLARVTEWLVALAIGLVVGGAIGNALDRVRLGAVVDFIDVHAFGWHWPAFNVADSAIVVGVALLFLDGLFAKRGSLE